MPKLEIPSESSRPHQRIGEIRALVEQGCTRGEISRRLGINYHTVKWLCAMHGLRAPRPAGELLTRVRELAPLHTRAEISAALGVSYSSIRNLCLRHDITPPDSPRYHGNAGIAHPRGVQPAIVPMPGHVRYEDAAVPQEFGRFVPPASDARFRTTAAVAVDHPMAGVGM